MMSSFKENNWWAVILGASSGMGLATAKKLGEAGVNLFLVHRDRRSVLEQAESEFDRLRSLGINVINHNIDGLDHEKRAELIADLAQNMGAGKIRVLLHSISKGNLKLMKADLEPTTINSETDFSKKLQAVREIENQIAYSSNSLGETDFTLTIQAMATSMLSWTQDLLNAGLFHEKARVIGLTSEGDQRIWKGYGAVGAAKATLDVLAKYMAVELAPSGLRTNIIQAGITETPSLKMIPGSDLMSESAKFRNPLGRLTTPEDVANVIYLLIQNEADWINGSKIIVDGGEHLV